MGKNYYLTVMENKWEVIAGTITAPCSMPTDTALQAYMEIVSLSGDGHTTWSVQSGGHAEQPVGPFHALQLLQPIQPRNGCGPDVGAYVTRWLMLPINPKIAILFLQGRNLMAGFHLGIEILSIILVEFSEEFAKEWELWEGQLCIGVTHTTAGVDMS
jgi:hypothetical protein